VFQDTGHFGARSKGTLSCGWPGRWFSCSRP